MDRRIGEGEMDRSTYSKISKKEILKILLKAGKIPSRKFRGNFEKILT